MTTAKTKAEASRNGKPSRVIDTNEIRAAHAELEGEPVTVLIGDNEVELPAEMPARVAFLANRGMPEQALDYLLGDNAHIYWDRKPPPTLPEVEAFFEKCAEVYGFETAGESSASDSS